MEGFIVEAIRRMDIDIIHQVLEQYLKAMTYFVGLNRCIIIKYAIVCSDKRLKFKNNGKY